MNMHNSKKAAFIRNKSNHCLQPAFLSVLIIAADEWFFHKYLNDHVFHEKHDHYDVNL